VLVNAPPVTSLTTAVHGRARAFDGNVMATTARSESELEARRSAGLPKGAREGRYVAFSCACSFCSRLAAWM
jgi:hypothetical protein